MLLWKQCLSLYLISEQRPSDACLHSSCNLLPTCGHFSGCDCVRLTMRACQVERTAAFLGGLCIEDKLGWFSYGSSVLVKLPLTLLLYCSQSSYYVVALFVLWRDQAASGSSSNDHKRLLPTLGQSPEDKWTGTKQIWSPVDPLMTTVNELIEL